MRSAKSMARASKSQEKRLRNKGFGSEKAQKIIINSNERAAKKKKANPGASKKAAEEEANTFKPRQTKAQKMELNRRKRGGSSVKGFKSKKKYKRR